MIKYTIEIRGCKKWKTQRNHFGTRNTGSQGNKCDGIDSVFEIDEAAEMRGNVSNDGSTGPDEYQRNDESNIAIGHCWKKMEYC